MRHAPRRSLSVAQNSRLVNNIMNWRLIYHVFSGVLFIVLGIIVFTRAHGYKNFFNAGLFGLLLCAFGVYRIIIFIRFVKKMRGDKA